MLLLAILVKTKEMILLDKIYDGQAKIYNKGSEEISVKNLVFAAFTNANGQIDYTKQADDYDKSLKIKMKNLFNGRKAHKDTINELKNKKEFSGFLNNWKYEGSIIYNAKLWKKNENSWHKQK